MNSIIQLLKEELGSFPQQKELSLYCAKEIVHNYRSLMTTAGIINVERFGHPYIKLVDYELIVLMFGESNGKFINITSEGAVKVLIGITDESLRLIPETESTYIVADTLSHELNHGNVAFNQYYNEASDKTNPKEYHSYIVMYSMESAHNSKSISALFAKAKYNTNFQERQAKISQFNLSLLRQNGGRRFQTKEELENIAKDNEIFEEYQDNLNMVAQLQVNPSMCNGLIVRLAQYGIQMSKHQLNRELVKIHDITQEVVRDLWRNAMLVSDFI